MNDEDVAKKVLKDTTGVILIRSKQKCRGVTVVNTPNALHDTARAFHHSSILMSFLTAIILLLGFLGIIFTPAMLVAPYLMMLFVGWLTLSMAYRDEITSRALRTAVKDNRPGSYVVVYHSKKTLIHELLHITHGDFDKKGSNLAQDISIEKEVRKILRETKKSVPNATERKKDEMENAHCNS